MHKINYCALIRKEIFFMNAVYRNKFLFPWIIQIKNFAFVYQCDRKTEPRAYERLKTTTTG